VNNLPNRFGFTLEVFRVASFRFAPERLLSLCWVITLPVQVLFSACAPAGFNLSETGVPAKDPLAAMAGVGVGVMFVGAGGVSFD